MRRSFNGFPPAVPTSALAALMVLGIDPSTSLPSWLVSGGIRGLASQKGIQVQNGLAVAAGITLSSGGSTADVSTTHDAPAVRKTTGTSLGSTAYEQSGVEIGALRHNIDVTFAWKTPADLTSQRFWAGITNAATLPTADTFTTNKGIAFRGSTTASDANYKLQTSTGAAVDNADTEIPIAASHVYASRIWTPDRGVTIYWGIADLTAGLHKRGTTQAAIPTTDTMFRGGLLVETRVAAARDFVLFGAHFATRLT